jgi:hypothetical protein
LQDKHLQFRASIAAVSLLLANSACAFDMGNMMNPSKWMGGNNDRYDDYYDGPGYGYPGGFPGYGYGGPPGYGPGPGYGYGYGGPPGYGPGYGSGYGGTPAYGAAPGYGGVRVIDASGSPSNDAEVMRLKERIRRLETEIR